MTELKTFKIEQKFNGPKDLYRYLLKNIEFVGESIGAQIQKPLKIKPFCLVGREKITERNILFFASEREFPESLGELVALASTFDIDIVIFFMCDLNKVCMEPLNWLQKICNDDTLFIVGRVNF